MEDSEDNEENSTGKTTADDDDDDAGPVSNKPSAVREVLPLSKSVSKTLPTKSLSKIMEEGSPNKIEKQGSAEKSKTAVLKTSINPIRTLSAFPAAIGEYGCGGLLKKRSPFIHDPPQPEERRIRFPHPRTPREYIINLRENLADFQESHGLPRTRDYSFLSLGLALAQETARAIYSVLLMFAELFPILAIVSLILRFALDKIIEILETDGLVPKLKKTLIFVVEMIVILIPLWILIGSIVIPLIGLIFAMFARMLRLKRGGSSLEKILVCASLGVSRDIFDTSVYLKCNIQELIARRLKPLMHTLVSLGKPETKRSLDIPDIF